MIATKILIVEDEIIIAEDIAAYLEKVGYRIVNIVASGREAIAAAHTQRPDLVLMDIMLRGKMDGVEAAQKIHQELKVPVVYLTANADETTLERAKATNPFGYVLKPFQEKELRVAIEIALSRHQAEVAVQKALDTAKIRCQQAEANNELKCQYFSMASHEFRTPLAVIKTSTEMLQHYDQQLSPEKKQSSLQRIRVATESMSQLLEDVLVLGRVECGKMDFAPASLDVVEFCQEILEAFRFSMGDQHTFSFVTSHSALNVCLDAKLIWHVLNNLLSNAIKYSPAGSTITLGLETQDTTICLHVKDQGIGIPASDRATLFEPFRRATNVGSIHGTGLGLAIAKRAIELHNGSITVESQVGQGTTFCIALPIST
jgi:signal transduction histidine kinase